MVESDEEAELSLVLRAASDPARRRILTLLVRDGGMRVTELAGHFQTSLNATSKHIKVLETAGLVIRARAWRDHVIRANPDRLAIVGRWMAATGWVWQAREERRSLNPSEE